MLFKGRVVVEIKAETRKQAREQLEILCGHLNMTMKDAESLRNFTEGNITRG